VVIAKNPAAVELGRRGGATKSAAKAEAARTNGAKGGRPATITNFLLIARKDGSSSTRRQRRFDTLDQLEAAVIRWRAAGFNVWWVYGPFADGQRPLLRQTVDDASL
jgi:hypothetical protein